MTDWLLGIVYLFSLLAVYTGKLHDYVFFTGAVSTAYFGQGTGPIHIYNVGCSGSESVLVQCNHLTRNIICGHADDAGVRCTPLGTLIRCDCTV